MQHIREQDQIKI